MNKIKTVEELRAEATRRGMNLKKMRFFLNEDRKEPKCFGIYKDESTGNWIVYKNKSDGTRSVRYKGTSEETAVNILYDKIKSETRLRMQNEQLAHDTSSTRYGKVARKVGIAISLIAILIPAAIGLTFFLKHIATKPGYYIKEDSEDIYYVTHDNWFLWDDENWTHVGRPEDYKDYTYEPDYYEGLDCDEITYEDYVEYIHDDTDSDWDDDDDWDSGYDYDSWDSSDTDWDSDW